MAASMLIDLTRCIGCRACVFACKEINGLPDGSTGRLSAASWVAVETHGTVHVRRQCMHCLDPACVSVCPVAALQKTDEGPVIYDEERCIGCRYCMLSCPFNVPRYEWARSLPRVQKCIFCYEKRVASGEAPACVEACPADVARFGEREDLIRDARSRIASGSDRYVDHIYGLEEAGGTSVLYLSGVPFESLGFPVDIHREADPRLTWEILSRVPNIASVGGVLMFGLWWIINRRDRFTQSASEYQERIEVEGKEVEDGSPSA